MTSRASNYSITTRAGTRKLQIRYYVPTEFQAAYGKKEVLRSLKTEDMKVAKLRVAGEAMKITAEISASLVKERAPGSPEVPSFSEPTGKQIDDAARYVYAVQIQGDLDDLEYTEWAKLTQRGTEESAKGNRAYAAELMRAALHGDDSASDPEYWQCLFGFNFEPGSVKESMFRRRICWATAEAAKRWADHDENNYGQRSSNPLFEDIRIVAVDDANFPPMPTSSEDSPEDRDALSEKRSPTIADLWPSYEQMTAHTVRIGTMSSKKSKVERFAEYVGTDTPIDEITKAQARTWRDLLHKTPRSAKLLEDLKHLSIEEVVEANKTLVHPTLSRETINSHIGMCSSFFDWLVKNDYVEANIFDGLSIPKPKKRGRGNESSRAPFTINQLQVLFDCPLFTGCAGDRGIKQLMRPGDVQVRNWRFWVPLLALYTGARQAELLQLEVADIKSREGVNYIEITNEGEDEDKRTKTSAGLRSVPIHSQLIKIGFLAYARKQRRTGQVRLFPEPRRDKRGNFSHAQKELMKPIDRMEFGLDSKGRKCVFHSFRHSFIDELRNNYSKDHIEPIVGHASASITNRYGHSEVFNIKKRREIIESVAYQGLDLSRLRY